MILGPDGNPIKGQELALETKAGNQIRNELPPPQPDWWYEEAVRIDKVARPDLIVRSAKGLYNCLGLVFSSRRTWIEDADETVQMILHDDSYRSIRDTENAFRGDLVLYTDEDDKFRHIGIIIETELNADLMVLRPSLILSKWGEHAEYIHRPEDVNSLLGTPTGLFTDRIYVS